jgi:hypothetical protein
LLTFQQKGGEGGDIIPFVILPITPFLAEEGKVKTPFPKNGEKTIS